MLMSEINETLERLRKSALSLNNIFVPEDLTERLGPHKFFSLLAIVKQTERLPKLACILLTLCIIYEMSKTKLQTTNASFL